MYQEIGLWSSIRQHYEEALQKVQIQGLAKKNRSEGILLVRAEPLELAEEACHRMVDVVRVVDGALLLDADHGPR